MKLTEDEYLAHYGILRRSGRYPWGSGGTQSERNRSFLSTVDGLRKQGLSDTEVARGLGLTTTQLRAASSIAKNEEKQANISMAQRLKDKGMSNVAIGEKMGINESSVRALLAPGQKDKADILEATSNILKDQVEKKGYIDVGTGVERHLGISDTKLRTAVARLEEQGYKKWYVKVEQLGTGQQTTIKVLAKPDSTYSEVFRNRHNIQQPFGQHSEDGGRTYLGMQPPISVSSKRVKVRYAEEGGADADGVIYVRPGAKDLSLGGNRYAQVRIAIDNTHYLKGMAVLKDDLPDGVDLVFNTNKSNTGNKLDAMKSMKDDPDNPFGAVVRQITDKDGKNSSAMNIVNDDTDWSNWSKTLSSQFASKQSPNLAKTQLALVSERKRNELDEILKLTNPVVRKKLLDEFADGADASAVHLKAAALPRQTNSPLLPVGSLKPTEVYAPNYRNGERVALVRHPHGGTFEIPELVVNNRNPEAKKLLGNAKTAIGIHPKVAQRLSGADFDGDTVLVIPNNNKAVKSTPALKGLENFDPQAAYPGYPGMKKMSAREKAFEMGDVSNLITDMTIRGASSDELARAVRHSMVVIDAEKHGLNYKLSAQQNGIGQLKTKYQGKANAGASTLVSRASSRKDVDERKQGYRVDPATGKKIYTETGATYTNSKGQLVKKKQRSTKLAETDDANTLSSGTVIEKVYADHSNRLKRMAEEARRASVSTETRPYSPSAKTAYQKQVDSLNAKLHLALRNAPIERQAQVLANAVVSQKRQANPDMDAADLKKIKGQALTEARLRTGAKKHRIDLTDDEWRAIQAGAISTTKLKQILDNADPDRVKQLATPRTDTVMSAIKKQRAAQMLASGYTQAEVADALGVAVSTLNSALSEGG